MEKKRIHFISESFVLKPDRLLLFHSIKSKQKSCQNEPSAGRFDGPRTRSDQRILQIWKLRFNNFRWEFFPIVIGIQPSMGEILVARGKWRRSGAPGMKERKKTVRDTRFMSLNLLSDGIDFAFKIVVPSRIWQIYLGFGFLIIEFFILSLIRSPQEYHVIL